MKREAITVRIDADLASMLDEESRKSKRTRSAIVNDALKRRLMVLKLRRLRKKVVPLAKAQGYLTDEDIFRDFS